MQHRLNFLLPALISLSTISAFAQGYFSGDLMYNLDYYHRDTTIDAANTPHYDDLKTSMDGWLSLNYTNDQFRLDAGMRLDLHHNSNLHEPGSPFNGQGVGIWYIRKSFQNLTVTGGNFYDQIGSGIAFRAYEERPLGIDNSLLGGRLQYDIKENWFIKGFAGVQKNRFDLYGPIIKGLEVSGSINVGENVSIIPGVGAVNRTLDETSMDAITANINAMPEVEDRFVPKYNTFVFAVYNTLNIKNFSWYVEGVTKTNEAIVDENSDLVDKPGNVIYTNLTYSKKGFGITGQFKRTENFLLRTSPNETLLNGMISFIPPITQQNALRLPARYSPSSQELEEMSSSLDLTFSPIKKVNFHLNFSDVRDFDMEQLYQEVYGDVEIRLKKKWKTTVGAQWQTYDQRFFENDVFGNYRKLTTVTPFVEFTYKFNRKHSMRIEVQTQILDNYVDTTTAELHEEPKDFGNWMYGLVEYNFSPWMSVSISDMYNYKPNPHRKEEKIHYYYAFVALTHKSHRLNIGYGRLVEGIVCVGGICRYEPAFSGAKIQLTSTF